MGTWNSKVGSQEISGITGKFGLVVQYETGQRLTRFCQENTLVIANALFQQCKRQFYTWTSPNGQYKNQMHYIILQSKMEKHYTVSKNKTWSWLWLRSSVPIQFRLKLKKTGKTTRPVKYDINKIPYDCTVEVMNRFKGLDLIKECLKKYRERSVILYRRHWPKPSQKKSNARRQSGCLRRLYK